MPSAILSVQGLTVVSDGDSIVRNISFDIYPGEIVALTGKSGSGKTSIALALLNLLPSGLHLQSGSIQWFGKPQQLTLPEDSQSWKVLRGSHIGYIQQDIFGAFDPVMTMGSQMEMLIRERAFGIDFDIGRELRIKMEEVGLHEAERLLSSYPHQLSGGQLQRCQVAMSIVIRPELLIADEPTSAIDKINQLELLEVFSMVRTKYKMAILCITHEEAVVSHLADREVQLGAITREFPLPGPALKHDHTSPDTVVLEVQGIVYTHSYGGMMYRKGATVGMLDFALHRGTCLGIAGESGSGKSTLAQLLVGLFEPSHGEIWLHGHTIDFLQPGDVRQLRSKVQLVMQDGRGSLHPYFTIREILNEIVALRRQEDSDFTIDLTSVLKEVALEDSLLERKADRLSGGECLRISIARALLMNPDVLICDESTSALDGETRDGIVELLLHLMRERGLALIFITHDERILRSMADEVLVMADGKVVEKGKSSEVIKYPTHPVTKRIFTVDATFGQKGSQ